MNLMAKHGTAGTRRVGLVVILIAAAATATAQNILVPNASFESPTPPPGFPATPQIDNWQKSAVPPGFDPAFFGGLTWDQLSGIFPNTPSGQPNHINNVLGDQAAYVFSVPGVGLFQDLTANVEAGKGYQLTLGIVGAGGILPGSSFTVSLYYRDAGNAPVTLGLTTIQYSAAAFPSGSDLVDFSVTVPGISAGNAAVGRPLGVDLTTTTTTGGGYWDFDNVRLTAIPAAPEPGPLALTALGLVGWITARQCQRRRM